MKVTITCGIIDDEDLGTQLLARYIARIPGLQLKWTKTSIHDLLIEEVSTMNQVDIIFFDLISRNSLAPADNYIKIGKYTRLVILTSAGLDTSGKFFPPICIATLHKPILFSKFNEVIKLAIQKLVAGL